MGIREKIEGTYEGEIIEKLDLVYKKIAQEQKVWREACGFDCVEGCGKCCVNFEPDILESEALYLASWMLDNKRETAEKIIDGTFIPARTGAENGCILFDEVSPYHCTVYNGRCCICRLFGYSGDRGKDGKKRFKPCKFYPEEKKALPFERRQYSEEEMLSKFSNTAPVMSDSMEQVVTITLDNTETKPLREALPEAIKRLLFLSQFSTAC